ncbi:lytic murein transglycosylase [Rhizobiales bacterium GAS191]|nr:lytic murein transglycosylase [Rhizobiales bacterium GAS191]
MRVSRSLTAFALALAAFVVGALPATASAAPKAAAASKTATRPADDQRAFQAFLTGLWPDAQQAGVSRETFDLALAGLRLDPSVLDHTRKQAEFERTIRDYLAAMVSGSQVEKGRALAARRSEALAVIERRFGVDRNILVALWGLESGYGAGIGGKDVISSLASLAFIGFRDGLFRDELIDALVILEQGHVARADMKGSWAGAMGQAQFMPSSFLKYATPYDGGARKDIWANPRDVLSSIANFLKGNGWRAGLPWGFEVVLPQSFDYGVSQAAFIEWKRRGLSRADGGPLPASGEALLFFPAGWRGPAFLITENFFVIKNYNTSDSYALSVGVLADRIGGASGLRAAWPSVIDGLDRAKLLETQKLLRALGLYDDKLDGRLGPALRAAARGFQAGHGLVPDGFPTPELLAKLRAAH